MGELDQHRQVDTGDDLDPIRFEKRQAQIRGRAPEHIRQDKHACRALNLADGARNRLSRRRGIVVPSNRDVNELRQLTDDRARRVDELVRELTVSHNDDANHREHTTPYFGHTSLLMGNISVMHAHSGVGDAAQCLPERFCNHH